jgi:hypothetical protein
MAIVTGGRIVAVEAKRDKPEVPNGMSMNVNVEDVSANKDEITVQFVFSVVYNEGVGHIKITGVMHAKDDPKAAKEIAKAWKDNKKVPDDFAEVLMNYVSYAGAIAGTFFSQPLGLNAPLMLMPIRVKPQAAPMQGPTKAEKDKAA